MEQEKENRIWSFCSGPCVLPKEVLQQAQSELLDYKGTGQSVMELSHRSKEFDEIIKECEKDLRELLKVPSEWKVVFMSGGATLQFACVPLNLLNNKNKACYAVNGTWSEKAMNECKKYAEVIEVFPSEPLKAQKWTNIVSVDKWKVDPEAAYLHYCDNETIMGVEYPSIPNSYGLPLVCDMSSNFCSRPIDFSKYACIYAGAQKNAGPAGVTIVLLDESKVKINAHPFTPTQCSYRVAIDNQSLYNTPPCFNIYMCGLFFKYMLRQGGLAYWSQLSIDKSQLLYNLIDNSNGFYKCPVPQGARSRMNVVFVLPSVQLDALFISTAKSNGFVQLNGHKSVGGCRASLYNGMPIQGVKALCQFMTSFQKQHST